MQTRGKERYIMGDFQTNCYLLWRGTEAMIVDPPIPCPQVYESVHSHGLTVRYIINTHGHIDHIGGNAYCKEQFPTASLVVHERDLQYLTDATLNLSTEIGRPFISPDPERLIRVNEEEMEFDGKMIRMYLTPGHTPGSMCLFLPEEEVLLAGDTLFASSVGRTDLPGGSFSDLVESLEKMNRLFSDNTRLLSGHGEESTMGHERKNNPFLLEYGERN